MKIDLDKLEQAISILLSQFKKNTGNEIEIKNDFYWDMSTEDIYNPYIEPKNVSLGQLTDDWQTLEKSVNSNSLIPYDLQRISNILKVISVENPIAF